LLKKIIIPVFLLLVIKPAAAQQPRFSMATDLALQRNFKKEQQYWVVGQTILANFHLTPKEGIYTWFAYYTNGNFKNNITAIAKSATTQPQQIAYSNDAKMRIKHFSIGWKKYLKGTSEEENNWSLYGMAGFGLLLGRVENSHSVIIDTAMYDTPVRSGKANFKRLTFDLGLGWELPVGGDFYFYTEAKVLIPASDYPSKFIFVNNNAPLTGILSVGLRVLF